MKALSSLPILAGLIFGSSLLAQSPGENTPTGAAGGFGGTVEVGSGTADPFELNFTRSITDLVVPGAVVPFTYTRTWHSRGAPKNAWRDNWSWKIKSKRKDGRIEGPRDAFLGYIITYPDGREIAFHKPPKVPGQLELAQGDPGTYAPDVWIQERFVIDSNRTAAHLYLADGSVVNWTESCNQYGCYLYLANVDDPYKRRVTISVSPTNGTTVTEPGGRWIHITVAQQTGSTWTSNVTTSLGQSVSYSTTYNAGGTFIAAESTMTYNGVLDSNTGQPLQAHYAYEHVQPWPKGNGVPASPAFNRLVWASDPNFKGPLKQVRYIYQDNSTYGGVDRNAILEERYATSLYNADGTLNAGVMVNRFQMQPWTWSIDQGGYSEGYFTRVQTRGDGVTRTLSYWNPTAPHNYYDSHNQLQHGVGYGQNLIDHFTDWTNNPNVTEQHEYDWNRYFQTPTKITDMRGNVITQQLEPVLGKVKKQTYVAEGTSKTWAYVDPANPYYVLSVTNERNKTTSFQRDAWNRIYQINHPDGGVENFWYNGFGQVTKHQRTNGNYEHFWYDNRGLLLGQWNPTAHATMLAGDPHTSFTYYPTNNPWADRLWKKTLPANVSGNAALDIYYYERDSSTRNNLPVRGRGLVSQIAHAGSGSAFFGYDAYGQKNLEKNEVGDTSWFSYDAYGRLATSNNNYGHTSYTYLPSNGSSTSPFVVASNTPDTITSPTGVVTRFDYDKNLRKISETHGDGVAGASTIQFLYDVDGNLTWVTDPLGHLTKTLYDSRNRKKSVTEAVGTPLERTTTYTYGDGINVTQIDKPDNTTQTKAYDPMNRLLTDTVPQSAGVNITISLVYNDSGTLYSVTDGNNHWTKFDYDESDRKVQMDYQGGATQKWSYDDAGNLATRTTVGGEIQSFGYDVRNRKVQMTWNNNAQWCSYDYDDASRLTFAQNGTGAFNANVISTVTRQYDFAGRLTLDRQNINGLGVKDVEYKYDGENKETRLYSTADGYDYTFDYDGQGRFRFIYSTGNSNAIFQYKYDLAGNETERYNWVSGVAQKYGRDALNRMSRRDLTDNNANFSSEVYTYDAMSRLYKVDRNGSDDDIYSYYQNGELKSANYAAAAPNDVIYTLDKAGNRTSITDGGVNKNYSPNVLNQYTAAEGATVTNGSEHEIAAYGGVSYDYINDGQLNSVSNSGNNYAMAYDALGRCVKRTLNGTVTYYIYDGEKPMLEYKANGTNIGWNVYGKGIDEILQRSYLSDSTWVAYFYQQDHEGNVTHLTDMTGAVLERYKYDAFGKPVIYNAAGQVISASAYNNRFMFTGRELAPPNLGFYEYRARAYHPGLGRFMSEDPRGFDAGDYNLFRYCANDPINRTDPDGMFGIPLVQSISGIVDVSFDSGLQSMSREQKLDTGNYSMSSSGVLSPSAQNGGYKVAQITSSGPEAKTNSGRNFEQQADKSAVKMLGEETHRPDVTQTGLITSGPPGRIGPVDEKIGPSDPMNLESKRAAREVMPPVPKGQQAIIVHYHNRTGPQYGPPSDTDRARIKTRTMYFTNREFARTGEYFIYRRGQVEPEIHYSNTVIP